MQHGRSRKKFRIGRREAPTMSKRTIRNLSHRFDHQSDDLLAVLKEIRDHPPRAAAIVAAALLEDSLRWSMESYLTDSLTEGDLHGLFSDETAPLASFHGKIVMGYALGMYGPAARNDLLAIKRIRNAFAHAPRSITFETAEIVTECQRLSYLQAAKENVDRKIMPLKDTIITTNPKNLFFDTAKISLSPLACNRKQLC
jgi:hypothetical protein